MSEPQRFRKKPVVIEAARHDNGVVGFVMDLAAWCGGRVEWHDAPISIRIPTMEGEMRADFGDWIIKGVQGEFYPCKPDIFEQTYEAVGDESA